MNSRASNAIPLLSILLMTCIVYSAGPSRADDLKNPRAQQLLNLSDEEFDPIEAPNADVLARLKRAVDLQKKKQYKLAISDYEYAIDNGLALFQSYYNLGVCYEKQGKYQLAYNALKEAHDRGKKHQTLCKHMANVCLKLKRNDEAQDWFHLYSLL
jgi:tetratricopeptide (TPR) repeat protein